MKLDDKQAVKLLHDSCLKIAPHWDEHLDFWEGDEPGAYNEVSVFANYVVDQYEKAEINDFDQIFLNIEHIIEQGTESARGLAVVGFLEGMQNISSHRPFGPSVFERWMRPLSLLAWQELRELWEGKASLTDVIRSQKTE